MLGHPQFGEIEFSSDLVDKLMGSLTEAKTKENCCHVRTILEKNHCFLVNSILLTLVILLVLNYTIT